MKEKDKSGGIQPIILAIGFSAIGVIAGARTFTHPGLTYTQGDLDRMKAMVEAKEEPFYSTFLRLKSSKFCATNLTEYSRGGAILSESSFEGMIGIDGRCAIDSALMWRITGDSNYADAAVVRLNANSHYTNTCNVGTVALDNGKFRTLIEAAELLRDYEGWKHEDRQRFFDMLVYPGYSTTGYPWNEIPGTTMTCYWGVLNGDPLRYGNQGLFGYCALMGIGVLLDNEIIYDRALRYIRAQPHRPDDLPYVQGPPNVENTPYAADDLQLHYNLLSPNFCNESEDWGYDEQLRHYIYPNGQCQESCRDQGHVMAGIGAMSYLAEVAWNQGDNLYGDLDDRLLKGWEWNIRMNLTGFVSYDDEPVPWLPSGVTTNIDEATFDNGLFYRVRYRCSRGEALWVATDRRDFGSVAEVVMPYMHYKIRGGRDASSTKWLSRAIDRQKEICDGLETCQSGSGGYGGPGWGTLTKYRLPRMAGDPGTWSNGVRTSGAHILPCTIKCADFDWYSNEASGEGFTYHDTSTTTNSFYRPDAAVALRDSSEGPVVTGTADGEWLQYTIAAGEGGVSTVSIRYRSANAASVSLEIDEGEATAVPLPASFGFASVSTSVRIAPGAHVLRLTVANSGACGLELASVALGEPADERIVWCGANNQYWYAKNAWSNTVSSARVSYADDYGITFATPKDSWTLNSVSLTNSASPRSIVSEVPSDRAVRIVGDHDVVVSGETAIRSGTLEFSTASNHFHIVSMEGGALSFAAGTTDIDILEGAGAISVSSGAVLVLPQGDIPSGIVFSGAGTIRVREGRTSNVFSMNALAGFTGVVESPEGATLGDYTPLISPACVRVCPSGIVRLEGGFYLGPYNNDVILPAIEVPSGATGTVWNTGSRSEHGQNLLLKYPVSGDGTLRLVSNSRGMEINGDNSGFTGTIWNTGGNGYSTYVRSRLSSGTNAQWIHERAVAFNILLDDASYVEFGGLAVRGNALAFNSVAAGQTVTIGARPGSVNEIDAPLKGEAVTIVKVGDTPLVLGPKFTETNAGTVRVESGSLEILSTKVLSAVEIAAGVPLRVVAGASLGSLTLQEGSSVTIAADSSWTPGGMYLALKCGSSANLSSASISFDSLPPGLSATAVVSGDSVYASISGTLVWNGKDGAAWSDSGAWIDNSGTAVSFSSGSGVSFARKSLVDAPTNAISVTSATIAGAMWVDAPTNTAFVVSGSGSVYASSLGVTGGGAVRMSAALTVTDGITVEDGALELAGGWPGNVSLGEGATLVVDANATIPYGAAVEGAGSVVFASGTTRIQSRVDSVGGVFRNLSGDVTIRSGAYVHLNPAEFANDTDQGSPFGRGTLHLEGGAIYGVNNRNNLSFGDIDVAEGTSSGIYNVTARSDKGVNLNLAGNLTGSGNLEVLSDGRAVTLNGTNTSFAGSVLFDGRSTWTLAFGGAMAGMPEGAVELNGPRTLELDHAAGTTMKFGSLVVTNESASVFCKYSGAVEVGRGSGGSAFNVPFSGMAPEFTKTGTGDLFFGSSVSFAEAPSADVKSGSITLAGNSFASGTVRIRQGAALRGEGLVGALVIEDGGVVSNEADETLAAASCAAGSFAKRGEGRFVLDSDANVVRVEGGVLELRSGISLGTLEIAEGASAEINAADAISAAEGASLQAFPLLVLGRRMDAESFSRVALKDAPEGTAWHIVSGDAGLSLRRETLVWNRGAEWTAEGAWRGETSGEAATFCDGDDVRIVGWEIPLGGATVRPRNMYVSGGPVISGSGSIDPETLSNGGTIYIKGGEGAAVRFGQAASGSFGLTDNGILAVPCGTQFNWLKMDSGCSLAGIADDGWIAGETKVIARWNYTDGNGIQAENVAVENLPEGLVARIAVGDRVATARVKSALSDSSPAEVACFNFGAGFFNGNVVSTNTLMRGAAVSPTLAGMIPGSAWNNLYETVGSNVAATVKWNGESAFAETEDGMSVSYFCNNLYGIQNGKPNYLQGYFDDWQRTQILVEDIPWPVYDVVLYASTDTMNTKFLPVEVNGTSYTWDSSTSSATPGSAPWGDSNATAPAAGVNALVLTDLTGASLAVTGSVNRSGLRGGIAALQIVNRMPLVWNGGSAGLRDSGKWLLFDAKSDYGDGRGVAFNSVGLDGTGTLTATVEVTSAASPARIFADVPEGRGYNIVGEGALSTGRLVKRGEGSLDIECPVVFTNGLDVAAGVVTLNGSFSGEAIVETGAEAKLYNGGEADLVSGSGVITVAGGTLKITELDALATFEGTLAIENATLDAPLPFHGENIYPRYGLGEKTKLRLSNATISRLSDGVPRGANNSWLPEVECESGTVNTVYNLTSRSQRGLYMRIEKPLSGGGTLRIVCQDRGLSVACDASAFAGTLEVAGAAGGYGNVTTIASPLAVNAASSFRFTRAAELAISPGDGSKFAFGALEIGSQCTGVTVGSTGVIASVGALGSDCTVEAPIAGNPVAFVKKGAGRLSFKGAATVPAGTTIRISDGSVAVDSTALEIAGGASSITSGRWIALDDDDGMRRLYPEDSMPPMKCSIYIPDLVKATAGRGVVVNGNGTSVTGGDSVKYKLWVSDDLWSWEPRPLSDTPEFSFGRDKDREFYKMEAVVVREDGAAE